MLKKSIVFSVGTVLLPLFLFSKINEPSMPSASTKYSEQVQNLGEQSFTESDRIFDLMPPSSVSNGGSVESPLYNILSISQKFDEPLSDYVQRFLEKKDNDASAWPELFYGDMNFAGPAKEVPKPRESLEVEINLAKYAPYFDVVIVVNTAKKGKFAKKANIYHKNIAGNYVHDREFSVLPGRGLWEEAPGNSPIVAPPGYELAVQPAGTVPPHFFWSITEAGFYPAQFLDKNHVSGSYGDHPMPNSVFFNMGQGQASHQGKLGDSGSAGCIRMSMKNSEYVFDLVAKTRVSKEQIPKIDQFTGEFKLAVDGSGNIEMNPGTREKSGKVTKLFGYKALYIINKAPEQDYSKLTDADGLVNQVIPQPEVGANGQSHH
jgi:hypothetical protein